MAAMKKFTLIFFVFGLAFAAPSTAQWMRANGPYGNGYVFHFLPFGNQLFAGGAHSIFVSSDNGITWSPRNTGLLPVNYQSLGIFDSILFAGSDEGQVFRSTDLGEHWDSSQNGLPSIEWVSGFLQVGNKLFLSSESGLFVSTNSGMDWQSTTLNSSLRNGYALAIAQIDTELFVGGWGNIYRSTDSGVTWDSSNTGIGSESVIAYVTRASGKIFAGASDSGLYVSTDDGKTWHSSIQGIPIYNSVVRIIPLGTSLLAFNGALLRSNDSGSTWILNDSAFDQDNMFDMILNGTRLMASGRQGTFYSDDTGASWDTVHSGMNTLDVSAIVSSGITMIAASYYGGFFASTDEGLDWTSVGSPKIRVVDLKVFGTDFIATTTTGIFLSSDEGNNWHVVDTETDAFQIAILGPTIIIATSQHGVLYSRDTGQTWESSANLLGSNTLGGILVQVSVLFAWTDSGFFQSIGPSQWTRVDSGFIAGKILALANGDLIAFDNYLLSRSTDEGTTWSFVGEVSPNQIAIASFDNTLYVGINYGGTIVSTDEGDTWDTVRNGPYYDNDQSHAINEGGGEPSMIEGADGYLFINAWEKGLYRLQMAPSAVNLPSLPQVTSMGLSNVPNPFSTQTTINFSLDQPCRVSISIFDMKGCEIPVVDGIPMTSGPNHIEWNSAQYPSGIYTVRIVAGESVESTKMVLLK